MEAKQSLPSVIARLMGYDEISPPPKNVHRPHRVLSEDYLRKSDAICLLETQSYRKRRLSKVISKTGQRNVNLIEVQGRKKLHRNSSDSRSEMADASHSPSRIVILRPSFFSSRKSSNQLLEKWKLTTSSKQLAVTRQSNARKANYGILDKLENKSEIGNDSEEISILYSCAQSCTDSEYKQGTEDTKETCEQPKKSGANIQGWKILGENLVRVYENSEGNHFESSPCNLDVEDEICPYIFDDFRIGQEQSVSPSYTKNDSELHTSLGEYYSPSPNSVLDPLFSEENLSSSDSFEDSGADPKGLQKQLQLLESRLEDTASEEYGLILSSDEDGGDGSSDYYKENITLFRLFNPGKSRDSSYMDDILDEANFFGNNMELGSKAWNSVEFPLNPSLFERLEKKYDKQSSWDKSERRLLFDRINFGLKHILYPYTDVFADTKMLRKSFKLSQSREEIGNELWRFLGSHENKVNKTLSEKVVGTETKWLDLCEDIDFIVYEIEHFLFEELSAEIFYD